MRKIFRILFSRYTVTALILLADLALIVYLGFYAYTYSFVFVLLSAIASIGVFLGLINKNANPEFKITWLVVMLLLPIFGAFLYLLFYSRRLTKSEAKFSEKMKCALLENMKESGDVEMSLANLDLLSAQSRGISGRSLSLLRDDMLAGIYTGKGSVYYSEGESFYSALLEALASAKKYILLEYFIVEDGEMWQGIYNVLKLKVSEGVEVRMLYDDIGSMSTVRYDFDKKLRAEGIMCYRFARVTPKLSSSHQNRDHRKIAVIDGEIAFTGGVNIADEYINKKQRFGHWKDGGIKVTGYAARGFARLFLASYDLTVRKISDYSFFLPKISDTGEGISRKYGALATECEKSSEGGFLIPFGAGPAPTYPTTVGKNILLNTVNMAESYIYVTTPYLIIDYELTEALCAAVRRGVDVRIITPAVADKKMVKIMTKNSYPYLINSGVRIFEYTPGFIHEKLLVADDRCAIVSTINLDYRSLVHHYEDGVFIYGASVVADARDSFLLTEKESTEITRSDAKLGFFERIIRDLIRIFAPLL